MSGIFNPAAISKGVSCVFYNAYAPLGWTQITDKSDHMMRSVSGAGGGSGGTNSPIVSHVHGTASHALSANEMPSHDHKQRHGVVGTGLGFFGADSDDMGGNNDYSYNHTHNVHVVNSGASWGHSHGNTGASFTPKYIDLIIAEKD